MNTSILPKGTVLHERYRIDGFLGQGGFGITYKGEDILLNIRVAIKEYYPEGALSRDTDDGPGVQWNTRELLPGGRREGKEDFLREARQMARLHEIPGIVKVRDTFFENDTSYIVMDFVEGVTLKDHLKKNGTMPLEQCVRLMAPLMKSLAMVHKSGLIHKDISPDNIVLRSDGTLCLLDLGAAKDLKVSGGDSFSKGSVRDMPVAKRGFSPPEQYKTDGNIGPWSDVYAFCSTIYYCIYGRLLTDALKRIENDTLEFPGTGDRALDEKAAGTLRRGLELLPENRISSMEELLAGFSFILEKGKKKGMTSKQKKIIGLISAGLVLAAAVIVILLVSKPWEVRVERVGNRNANLLSNGWFVRDKDNYQAFVDAGYNMYICDFDESILKFTISKSVQVGDSADALYLNAGKDRIYFEKSDGEKYCFMSCGEGGEDMKKIYENDTFMTFVQYAMLSDGNEYLYYLQDEGKDSYLYRIDVSSGEREKVIDGVVFWFNIYENSIYYSGLEGSAVSLKKCDPNGKKDEVLNTRHNYYLGFVEDDMIFIKSISNNSLEVLDLEGNLLYSLSEVPLDLDRLNFTYEDCWIYYGNIEDRTVKKCYYDGSRTTDVCDDIDALRICSDKGSLWVGEGDPETGYLSNTYITGTLPGTEKIIAGN
ncbi:MAG: protein kinase domain-containing protein [Lachnospiraceae bacterium]|jgi:serine/threonine protein kinase